MKSHHFSIKLNINSLELRVNYFKAFEGFSHDFTAHLVLLLEAPFTEPARLRGQNATVVITMGNFERYFNGYVLALQYSPFVDPYGYYKLKIKLVSWPVLFKNTCEYQIFVNKSVPEILQELFKNYPSCHLDLSQLKSVYPKIAYCVQYQESRWQFMRRLLNQAKIHTYIEHEETKHHLVCIEQNSMPLEDLSPQSFWAWQTRLSLSSPDTWHSARSSHLKWRIGQNFHYQEEAYQIVGLRHFAQDLSHGSQAGFMSDQPHTYFNQAYLLARGTLYPHKLQRSKPYLVGVQTATVVETSELGVNLKFPWSKEATQIPRPSLSPLADGEQSINFNHAAGTELLIGFDEADPEQPLALAACYSHKYPAPLADSWASGIKSPQGSELLLDDTPQQEEVSLKAAHELKLQIKGEQQLQITGAYKESCQGSTQIEAQSYTLEAASLSLQAGGSLIKISPDEILITASSIDLN